MAGPTRSRATLTVKKLPPPCPVAIALSGSTSVREATSFDRLVRRQLSVAELLAGGELPALGRLFGALAVPADGATGTDTLVQEDSDDLRSE